MSHKKLGKTQILEFFSVPPIKERIVFMLIVYTIDVCGLGFILSYGSTPGNRLMGTYCKLEKQTVVPTGKKSVFQGLRLGNCSIICICLDINIS